MRTFNREMFHSTMGIQQIHGLVDSKLYKLVCGVYKLTLDHKEKLLCAKFITNTSVHSADGYTSQYAYMITTDGAPYLRLFTRNEEYGVEVWSGSKYSSCCTSKTIGHLVNKLSKAKTQIVKVARKDQGRFDINLLWKNLLRRNLAKTVRTTIERGFKSCSPMPEVDLYSARYRMSESTLLWLLRVLIGDVARTDTPQNEQASKELADMSAKAGMLVAARAKQVADLQRYCSPHKWVVVRHFSGSDTGGYSVGAYDCTAMFAATLNHVTNCEGVNANVDPVPLMAMTYYKTLDDLPDHIKPDLMSQLYMARISANATHPNVPYAEDQLPQFLCTDASLDAGWAVHYENSSLWYVVDKAPQ